jgi:hypothetical protein
MLCLLCLFVGLTSYAQDKVAFRLTLLSSDNPDPEQWIFRVKLVNTGFDRYWVQDTVYLVRKMVTPYGNLIRPYIFCKEKEEWVHYDSSPMPGVELPDTYFDSCHNCIFINKNDSLSFDIPLLRMQRMKKGEYKMIAAINIPISSCPTEGGCEQLPEIESNYVFFTVKQDAARRTLADFLLQH